LPSRFRCTWTETEATHIGSEEHLTRGSVGWACVAHPSFCLEET
jgi:hypothetical protein